MSSANNDGDVRINPVDGLIPKFSEVLESPRNQSHLPQATSSTNHLTSPGGPCVNGNNWTRQSTVDSIKLTDDDDDDDDEDSDSGEESDSRCGSEYSVSDSDASDSADEVSSFRRKSIAIHRWFKDLDPVRQAALFHMLMEDANLPALALVSNHARVKHLYELEERKNANSVDFLQKFLISSASSSPETVANFLFKSLPLVDTDQFPPTSSLVLSYLHLVTSTLDLFLSPPVNSLRAAELVSLCLVVSIFSTEQKKNTIRPYASRVHLATGANNLPAVVDTVPPFDVSNLPKIEPFSGPGMADVPAYLKSLRLHKYTNIFASIPTLSHFIALTEKQLEELGVAAKGARKKFVQSLQKLQDRPQQLNAVMNTSSPQEAMQVIASVISAPLSTDSPEANLIVRLLLKLKDQVKGTEHEEELRSLVKLCLKQNCWSKQNLIFFLQFDE